MKKLAFLFFTLFFLVNCCQTIQVLPPTYHLAHSHTDNTLYIDVKIDKDFSTAERAEIEETIGALNTFFNHYYVYRVVDDRVQITPELIDEVRGNRMELLFIQEANGESGILGEANGIPGSMIILYTDTLQKVNDPERVILHEELHTAGAFHNQHKGSVMYPAFTNQGTGLCVDQYVVSDILKANGQIEKAKLNYCVIK